MKINKRNIIIFISILLMTLPKYLIKIDNLSSDAIQVLGIFIGILLLWISISITWPSLLLILTLGLVPSLKFSSILSSAYGNTTFVFLLFTFVLTYALSKTSFLKLIANKFITSKLASKGPWYFICSYFSAIIFIGLFISPTILFFVFLPILDEIYETLKLEKGNSLANMLMMGTVIMCGISSGMTPIAHAFPITAMGLYQNIYQTSIDYLSYMIVAIPTGLVLVIMVILIFKYILKPDTKALYNINHESLKMNVTIAKSEKIVLATFIFVVLLWILPSLIILVFNDGIIYDIFHYINSLGSAFPPLIGIVILSIVQIDNKSIIDINEAIIKGVSWPALLMCASTLALGSAIVNENIGITIYLTSTITPLIENLNPLLMIFIFTLWAALQTNLSSNLVTASVVTTTALAITKGFTNINIEGLVIIIGMMASFAFATPPAMPCVAYATSSGWTNTISMLKYGFSTMLLGVILATFISYPIATIIF